MFTYLSDVLTYLAFGILMAACLWYVDSTMKADGARRARYPREQRNHHDVCGWGTGKSHAHPSDGCHRTSPVDYLFVARALTDIGEGVCLWLQCVRRWRWTVARGRRPRRQALLRVVASQSRPELDRLVEGASRREFG